jgi:transposase InsO family protein
MLKLFDGERRSELAGFCHKPGLVKARRRLASVTPVRSRRPLNAPIGGTVPLTFASVSRDTATPSSLPAARHDRDRIYGDVVTRRLRAMGIRDKPTARASPWQNGFAERLIGSIRRECVDHIIVVGKMHLRRVLKSYAGYYNSVRTHRSLNKNAPVSRPVQQTGNIRSQPILDGLHHHYVRGLGFW